MEDSLVAQMIMESNLIEETMVPPPIVFKQYFHELLGLGGLPCYVDDTWMYCR